MSGCCSKHGPQDKWCAVCLGIGEAVKENRSLGFVWGISKHDGMPWAICNLCDSAIVQGYAKPHQPVPLCKQCFNEAWEINGRPDMFKDLA